MSAADRRIAPAPRTDWPENFEDHLAGTGCPICTNDFTAEDIGWGLLINKGPFANAYLWRSGQVRGYVVVIFTARHVAEPTAMTSAEAAGFWNEALAAGRAVEQYYRPLKLNYQLLGNAVPHAHFHITPRRCADQDPAPGGPLPFDVLDHGRQDEEQLQSDARGLRELLGRTGSSVVSR
ncbi:HIT family protein [Streptomyces sp. NPDC058470]|uniref:HIT family protein n=1 Tax=Streptomyces sp. NPDC058470 TaxID=3346515 RepID=UPI00365889BB